MFERFTKDARAVVVDAQEVAVDLRTATIDTRHLVVALARREGTAAALRTTGLDPADVEARCRRAVEADDSLDGAALASVGVDLDEVRRRTDEVFGRGALERAGKPRRQRSHHPFTPDAKKSLELALREAVRLGDKSIGERHLMLGVLRADCPGGRVLQSALHDAGSDVAALRAAAQEPRAA
ncbi:Clp protease N-terminal domain-containing protein [Isoptericola sp. NPDC019693]|uniref:Clp protease N-terminal domain-containing protein n=1 Tax=Isoptericola sp. NPDC019693 TaxID=3364009 RepID=UPI003798BA17